MLVAVVVDALGVWLLSSDGSGAAEACVTLERVAEIGVDHGLVLGKRRSVSIKQPKRKLNLGSGERAHSRSWSPLGLIASCLAMTLARCGLKRSRRRKRWRIRRWYTFTRRRGLYSYLVHDLPLDFYVLLFMSEGLLFVRLFFLMFEGLFVH